MFSSPLNFMKSRLNQFSVKRAAFNLPQATISFIEATVFMKSRSFKK